jgi:guanylate kinase
MKEQHKVGVVGPCAAGKSTLVSGLQSRGYNAKNIAQEHSYVPAMWERMSRPEILVFLDVSYEQSLARRRLDWTKSDYDEQQHRLQHARQHADYFLDTDSLSIEEVLELVCAFLETR